MEELVPLSFDELCEPLGPGYRKGINFFLPNNQESICRLFKDGMDFMV